MNIIHTLIFRLLGLSVHLILILYAGNALAMGGSPVNPSPDDYTKTKYPIVLVHGLGGFDSILGIDYWYGIPKALRDSGATVYIANVQATNTVEVRGEQLIHFLESIKATDKHPRFNLIGHSYGGPTIRYAAGVRPDLVASATSVGGVNKGTELADNVLKMTEDPLKAKLFWALTTGVGVLIDGMSKQAQPLNQDVKAAVVALSTEGAAKWNKNFPAGLPSGQCYDPVVDSDKHSHTFADGSRVYFYSWMGVGQITNWLDPDSLVVGITKNYMNGTDNDGLVPRCSAHLGKVIADNYPYNHLDEINQLFGQIGKDAPNPVELYRIHANRLRNQGL